MRILAFDVSSTCTGWALLLIDGLNISLLNSGVIFPPHTENEIEDLANTRDMVIEVIQSSEPDDIAIENIIQFMGGKSSAATIIKLTTYNRMVSLCAYDYLFKSPKLFSVMSIRHGIKKSKELPKKEDIPDLVAEHLGFKFDYLLKKNGTRQDQNFDRADAIAVGLYCCFLITGKIVKKKVSKKKVVKKRKK